MRLTLNNIKFVKEHRYNGVTYAWYVAMKSNLVSDGLYFRYYTDKGISGHIEYPVTDLPKTVQKYLAINNCGICIETSGILNDEYDVYMY